MYNPYAAGGKVYNGGSSTATQGKVDPTGYIERSLNQQLKKGPSYTPGVAAGALNRLGVTARKVSGATKAKRKPIVPGKSNNPLPYNSHGRVTGGITGQGGAETTSNPPNPAYTKGTDRPSDYHPTPENTGPMGPGQPTTPVPPPPPVPPVTANPIGAIGYTPPVGVTLDPDLEAKRITLDQQLNDMLMQLDQTDTQAEIESQATKRDASMALEDQRKSDINNAAYRGMAYSGGYADTVDRTQQGFIRQMESIMQRLLNTKNTTTASRKQAKLSTRAGYDDLYSEAAQRLADKSIKNPADAPVDPNYTPPADTPVPNIPQIPTPTSPDTSKPPAKPGPNPAKGKAHKGKVSKETLAARKKAAAARAAAAKRKKGGK